MYENRCDQGTRVIGPEEIYRLPEGYRGRCDRVEGGLPNSGLLKTAAAADGEEQGESGGAGRSKSCAPLILFMDFFEELFSSLIELPCSFIIADSQGDVIELLKGVTWLEVLFGIR